VPSVDRADHGHSEGGSEGPRKVKNKVTGTTAAERALYTTENK